MGLFQGIQLTEDDGDWLQAEADEQRQEFGDLLACLGQESAKVSALQALLAEHSIDASALLAQVAAADCLQRL